MAGVKYNMRTRLAVPQQALLAKGFFCLPIRTSCFIISVLSLITSLLIVSSLFATLSGNNLNGVQDDSDGFHRVVTLLLCAFSLDIIASTLLFFGSLTERKNLVLPYAVHSLVLIFMGFLAIAIGSLKATTTWRNVAISVAVQGVSIYFWMIVVSYYHNRRHSSVLAEKVVEF